MTKYMLVIMMRSFVQERRDARLFSNDGKWTPTNSSVLSFEIFSQTSGSLSSNGFQQT
jgi:hypothetical protein